MTQDIRSGPGDLAPGDQVAGYQVQEQIGRGGMAVVYRALDLRLGRLVALKVLAPHLGEDEAFRQRFIRESRAAAGVDHPHIVPVFEAGEADGVLFIAMRYISRGDVRSLLDAEGRLSPARTAALANQVASALDAAHAYGLVHRDVKPGNMLLGKAGDGAFDHVYLSDFGLSKHSLSPSTLTSTGQFLGTLDYVSPEQIQGQPVDGRADQYALACTVVEMLTGAPPFRRDDSMALMWAQLEAEPPRLSERRHDLPRGLDQVIATAMAKSPAGRYPACRDFAEALSMACASGTRAAPAASRAARSPGEAEQRPWPSDAPWAGAADQRPGRPDTAAARQAGPVPSGNAAAGNAVGSNPASSNTARGNAARGQAPSPAPRRPTEHARLARAPQTRQDDIIQGTGTGQAGRRPGQRGSGGGRRNRGRRNKVLAGLLVAIVLAVAGAVGYKLLDRPQVPATPAAGATTTVHVLGPAATVRAYFVAINQHRYREAWRLLGRTGSLATFENGYAGTAYDRIRIQSVRGNVVDLTLRAVQTDGSVKLYQGSYTVTGGVITKAHVVWLNG